MNPDFPPNAPPAMPEYAVLPSSYIHPSKMGRLFLKIIMAHQKAGKGKKVHTPGKPIGNVGARHGGGKAVGKGGKK